MWISLNLLLVVLMFLVALMFDVHLMGFESLINPPRPVDTPGHGKTVVGAIKMRSNQIVTYFQACMCGEHAILNKFDQI